MIRPKKSYRIKGQPTCRGMGLSPHWWMGTQSGDKRTPLRIHSNWYYVFLAFGLCCAIILTSITLLIPQQAYARRLDSMPGGNVSDPTIRGVDIAKPAIVRILTVVPGHLTIHFPPTTDVSFPQQSNGNYSLSFSGTGTFISSQGDVLTAGHVVQPPKDQVLNPALYSAAAQDVANYMNQNGKAGSTQVSTNDVIQQLTSGQLPSTPSYDSPTSRVYLSTDYAGTFTAPDLNSVPGNLMGTVDSIKAQSSSDQQDLAIVHVPMADTPEVPLGNSDNVQQQDQLSVSGFPGKADVNQKPQNFLASSISSVTVSSKKTSDNGTPLIQIGGNIDPGDNGGPALNSHGELVGIVSVDWATANSNNGGSTSSLQASNSARDLAQSIKLDMAPGSFQKQWSQAFNDYAATTPDHWHKAQQEFTQLAHSYPQFQAVQPFLTYAQTQAQTEAGNSAAPTSAHNTGSGSNSHASVAHSGGLASWQVWAIIIGAVVLLLALTVSLFTVAMRKKPSATAEPKPSESFPIKSMDDPLQSSSSDSGGQNTLSLKVWPCGHMNRLNARFCSICGEPAPASSEKK